MSGRSPVEHSQAEQRKRDRWAAEERVSELIDACSAAFSRGGGPDQNGVTAEYYRAANRQIREELLPLLRSLVDGHLEDRAAGDESEHGALDLYLRGEPRRFDGNDPKERRLVLDAFHALAEIAQGDGLITEELRNRVDTVGFTLKTGEHLQDWEMDLGDPVKTVTRQAGTLKTLFTGGTGMGKSAALETEAEDYYQQNFREGRDYKVIDLVGMRDGENWFYDIPQQDERLRNKREEMGLAPDFTDEDGLETPTVEILHPLTPGLSKQELPFDTEREDFVVRPFTVPASELRKPLLVALIMSRVSDQEENIIRQAYDDVDRSQSDWALADLAEEIVSRQELGPKHKDNAVGVLRSLQDVGYIRTEESAYTADWREIFTDTETITVFSQAFCEDEIGKLAAVAYLFDAIVDNRERMYDVPECVLLMRELWKIVPHRNRQEDDARAASIQDTISSRMTKVMRENRHHGIHVLADTQWPSDLSIAVRRNFNRYVVFGGRRDLIKDIFEWTQNGRYESFYRTMTAKTGEAGIVGQVEPAINRRRIEFLSPVSYVPPSHHHRKTFGVQNGWRGRAELLEHEETRYPTAEGLDWPDAVPEELHIGDHRVADDDDSLDVRFAPVQAFADECLECRAGEKVKKKLVKSAFNEFVTDHDIEPWDFDDQGTLVTFGTRMKDATEMDIPPTHVQGDRAYQNLRLNSTGKEYLNSDDS